MLLIKGKDVRIQQEERKNKLLTQLDGVLQERNQE
jgi:hypothetical protein